TQVRRGLVDSDLDVVGPALTTLPERADHTLVVPMSAPPRARATLSPPRSGDTGPLPSIRRRHHRRGWVALLVVLLLASGLSAAAWFYAAGPGSFTSTPSLLNLSQEEAADKARAAGLTMQVVVDAEYDETVAADHVLRTDPGPNERIKEGGTIKVVLSKGPERYAVPGVTGLTEEAARRAITGTHLAVGDVKRKYSDTVDEGRVISADPAAGTKLKRDSAVNLVVSKGIEPVAVPDVVGDEVDDARAEIGEAQLGVSVSERFDEKVEAGLVISQSPRGGTAPKGSEVKLVVSKGPPLVEVPEVVGRPLAEATTILQSAGFQVRPINLPGGPDQVLDQSPNGGERHPKGTTVTLSVY
ncbi:MAG: PASTA domain-containing protein, partial [Actinomycetes bacterium]